MKTIGFVVPYFTCGNGTVHPMTQLWLDSCENNATVDWLFFTDCNLSSFDIPQNVKVYRTTFTEVRARIQKIFDFEICLNKPYKLCDFKPVYGEAFAEELKKYDFWGFCDIDLIWGNIRKFLSDDILEQNDRILTHGHCSLFKNDTQVNAAYRTLDPKGCMNYKEVFSSDKLWAFDEWSLHNGGGYAEIQKRNGVMVYDAPIFADIQINRYSLHTTWEQNGTEDKSYHTVFRVNKNSIEKWCIAKEKILRCEYIYVHFQQRKLKMESNLNRCDYLVIPPNKAVNRNSYQCDVNDLKKLTKGNVFSWNVKGQVRRILSLMYAKVRK